MGGRFAEDLYWSLGGLWCSLCQRVAACQYFKNIIEEDECSKARLVAQIVPWTCNADGRRPLFEKYGIVAEIEVQLQHEIKQEAEQFRQWKASREKELLQLRKEGRRNEYERHKLQALNQCQNYHLV